MFTFRVAGIVVLMSYNGYFAATLVAPVAKVCVATTKAGATPGVASQLLIVFPAAGWAVLMGVLVRIIIYGRVRGPKARSQMEIFTGSLIAGDALSSFYSSIAANFRR